MRALEGHRVSSKCPPRVLDQNNGVVGGTEENGVFPFCPPGKPIIFYKRQTEIKMELVTRLSHNHQTRETLTESHGQELQTDTESWKSSSGYRLVITVPAGSTSGQFSSTGLRLLLNPGSYLFFVRPKTSGPGRYLNPRLFNPAGTVLNYSPC